MASVISLLDVSECNMWSTGMRRKEVNWHLEVKVSHLLNSLLLKNLLLVGTACLLLYVHDSLDTMILYVAVICII